MMNQKNITQQAVKATKWSAVTELMAKLVTPVTSMVLARLLTPEAYGVVATVTMIITFTEIFSEAGFHRYLVQHEFKDDEEKYKTANVAFITNFVLSMLLWGVIILFRDSLAELVGNPGLGNVVAISCMCIPILSLYVIQNALYQRAFDFKTLFFTRLVGILIPFVVTIPLALWLRSYWALIIGMIAHHFSNALILTIKSKWKPSFTYYSFARLKEMFSFSVWIIMDSILVWATSYIDIFMIGLHLNAYYLGMYKTAISTVGQIMSLITAVILPVMLPTLSRLQNDKEAMTSMILKFQKKTSIILLPLGMGIFVYCDLITSVYLGSQWYEAAGFIGLWGMMSAITIVFSRFCSVIYPAIGMPKVSVMAQILHLVVLIPAVLISVRYGYEALYITRSLVRLEGVLVNLVITYILIRLSFGKMMKNIMPETVSTIIMTGAGLGMIAISENYLWQFISIALCVLIYFTSLYLLFPSQRQMLHSLLSQITSKTKRK